MSMKDFRSTFSQMLKEDYKHHDHDDLYCGICGKKGGKLALHVIEYTQDQYEPFPKYFVPMSASFGRVRGCFPVCDKCCPPCKKCNLPRYTENINNFIKKKNKELKGNYTLMEGCGVCQHIQWKLFFKYLFKRIFHTH